MNILVINPFGIGDVLFSTPLISALRRHYPKGRIAYLCNKRTEPILTSNPNIDKVFVFEKDEYRRLWKASRIRCIKRFTGFLKELKRERFDLALDLSLRKEYSFYLWFLGVPRRIGFDQRRRGRYLTERLKIDGYYDKHVIRYYFDLLRYLGIEARNGRPEIFIADEDKKWAEGFLSKSGLRSDELLVGVIPGGGTSWGENVGFRRWMPERFAEVADALKKSGVKVIILGSEQEVELCNDMASEMKDRPILACGVATLMQFAALLKKCSLVITNDGGPLHMAVAAGTKTVSIFGPVDDKVYGPYPPGPRHIVLRSDLDCYPCYKGFKASDCRSRDCLRSISTEEAIEAAERLL